MSTAIFKTNIEAKQYRKYLKNIYKNNIVFTDNENGNEVIYNIPFKTRK